MANTTRYLLISLAHSLVYINASFSQSVYACSGPCQQIKVQILDSKCMTPQEALLGGLPSEFAILEGLHVTVRISPKATDMFNINAFS